MAGSLGAYPRHMYSGHCRLITLLPSLSNSKSTPTTHRNDNSSRFGKFTQLQFQQQERQHRKKPVLVGSKCETYLLEKSRVVHHSRGERNYHVFYQLLAAPEAVKAKVGLAGKGARDWNFLVCDHGGTDTAVIEGVSDAVRFQATAHALSLIGVEEAEQEMLWGLLAGILHLGQVQFCGEEGASGDEEARIRSDDDDALAQAAALLMGDGHDNGGGGGEKGVVALGTALCSRTVKTRHETYAVPMTPAQAVDARDALAKELYARLFAWLVDRINASTFRQGGGQAGAVTLPPTSTLGLLDIFGFESFAVNRYEQVSMAFVRFAE